MTYTKIITEISVLRVGNFSEGVNICWKVMVENVFDLTRLLELVD
jgi:hypothetical protein